MIYLLVFILWRFPFIALNDVHEVVETSFFPSLTRSLTKKMDDVDFLLAIQTEDQLRWREWALRSFSFNKYYTYLRIFFPLSLSLA